MQIHDTDCVMLFSSSFMDPIMRKDYEEKHNIVSTTKLTKL